MALFARPEAIFAIFHQRQRRPNTGYSIPRESRLDRAPDHPRNGDILPLGDFHERGAGWRVKIHRQAGGFGRVYVKKVMFGEGVWKW